MAKNGLFIGARPNILGANPDYVEDNPKGYWEFKPAIEVSDQVLSKLGGTWDAPPESIATIPIKKENFSKEIAKAKRILAPFNKIESPWGWKDPRNSLLINFWRLVYPNLKILVCVRNPLEVAFSLSKRIMSRMDFQDGLKLWNDYNNAIFQSLSDTPYLVTHYESYFYNPKKELIRVKQFFGLDEDKPINLRNIDQSLYRGMLPEQLVDKNILSPDIKELYGNLCNQAGEIYQESRVDTDYQEKLQKESFYQLFSTSINIFDKLSEENKRLQNELQGKSSLVENLQAIGDEGNFFRNNIDHLRNELLGISSKIDHIHEIEDERNALRASIDQLHNELQGKNSLIDQLFIEIERTNDFIARQVSEIESWRGKFNEINIEYSRIINSRQWKLLSKFRPIYGKIYWTAVKWFHLKHENPEISNHDPISAWIKSKLISPENISKQIEQAEKFPKKTLFSFLTPVYNPPIKVLTELLESILNQTYPHWELCIVDGGTDPEVTLLLESYSQQEPRIKFKKLDQNYGISGNSNQALSIAKGEFIIICDHDDLVEPNLLFEAVSLFNQKPAVDMIYYDEDKMDENGNHFHPFLKPSTFSPDHLISANYLTHCIIRTKLVRKVGGFSSEFDGAQDWDLFLKIAEETSNVYHINKILYHWRSVSTSAASGAHIKPYALNAQQTAIENHLNRLGMINPKYHITDHVRRASWEFPQEKISYIIPATQEPLKIEILNTLVEKIGYPNMEYIIIGNTDNLTAHSSMLSPNVVLMHSPVVTTAEAINQAAESATGDYLFFGHPSMTPLSKKPLRELMMWLQKPGVGIASSKLVNSATGKIYSFGKEIGVSGLLGDVFKNLEVDSYTFFGSTMNYYNFLCVSLYGMMLKKETFQQLGALTPNIHEDFSALNLFLTLSNQGLRVVASPFAKFNIYPKPHIPTHADILHAYEILEKHPVSPNVYYNKSLSFSHFVPILSNANIPSDPLDLETVFLRHYRRENPS